MKPIYYRLTRDCNDGSYRLLYVNGHRVSWFCSCQWHKFTGIRLRKGTKVKVKVTKLKNGLKMEIVK